MKYLRFNYNKRTHVIDFDSILSIEYFQGDESPEGDHLEIFMPDRVMILGNHDANRLYAHISAAMKGMGIDDVDGQGIRFVATPVTD